MAVLFLTGFEAGDLDWLSRAGWITSGLAIHAGARQHADLAGNSGNYSVDVTGTGTDTATPAITGSPEYLHVWVEPIDSGDPDPLVFVFEQSTTAQVTVRFAVDGVVQVLRGEEVFGTLVGASGGSIMSRTVGHWLTIRVLAAESGTCTIAVDGVQVYTVSGDLRATGTDGWTRIRLRAANSNSNHTLDDLIVEDTAGDLGLPPQFVQSLHPSSVAAGNLTGTGASGSGRWANVSTADDDATYNSAAADGDEDRYGLSNVAGTIGEVLAIAVHTEARASGGIVDMDPLIESGSTVVYEAGVTLSSDWLVSTQIFEEDPDASDLWDTTTLNALKVGVRFGA